MTLLQTLKGWRMREARKLDIELFRILPNKTLFEIAEKLPQTEPELLVISGIGPKKLQKYGSQLLLMVSQVGLKEDDDNSPAIKDVKEKPILTVEQDIFIQKPVSHENHIDIHEKEEKIFTVSHFLDLMNIGLKRSVAKIRGEVSSISVKNGHCYFTLQDKNRSVLNAIIWKSNYLQSGITIEVGMELVAFGYPEIYKPSGRLAFMASTIELVGEGALKAAYDKLKSKLMKEGVFDNENKKAIPDYPERIGVITSKTGAVIHDFLNNIGRHGFKISFYDSRVEGVQAVSDLIAGIKYFKKNKNIDLLVIIRGGGSLESLQAFNNEMVIREMEGCSFPVLAGIGHDKDVPLMTYAADAAVSTPTATAKVLNKSYEQGLSNTQLFEASIMRKFEVELYKRNGNIQHYGEFLSKKLLYFISYIDRANDRLQKNMNRLEKWLFEYKSLLYAHAQAIEKGMEGYINHIKLSNSTVEENLHSKFKLSINRSKEKLVLAEKLINMNNPERLLKLGFTLSYKEGKIVRSVTDMKQDEKLRVVFSDGEVVTSIKSIKKK